jgi:hypothetical protein
MNDIMRGTFNPDSGFATQGNDDKVWAQFYVKAEVDGEKSKAAGHPVFRDVTYCKMIQPGESRLSQIDRPATDQDVARFPRQWEAFKRGKSDEIVGAPLSLLFPSHPAIVENFRRIAVHTIEQLASLPDTALQEAGMGGRQFQEKARDYLAKAESGKGYHALSDKLDALALKMTEKDNRIAALETALARATSEPEKRGPGRPRKDEAA